MSASQEVNPRDPSHTFDTEPSSVPSHVDRVCDDARAFVARVACHADQLHDWHMGAVEVASALKRGAGAPTELTASCAFIPACGLDDLTNVFTPALGRLLLSETDRRVAAALSRILPADDLEPVVRVGTPHGRAQARPVLVAMIPRFMEFEHGIAASRSCRLRCGLKEAA